MGGGISASQKASHTPAIKITHGQTVPGAFKKPGRGSCTIKYHLVRLRASTWRDGQVGCPGSTLEALVCLENRIKRTHPNLAACTNHFHLAARTMTHSDLRWPRGEKWGVGVGRLRPESSDLQLHRKGKPRHRCPLSVLDRTNSSTKSLLTHTGASRRGPRELRVWTSGAGDARVEGDVRGDFSVTTLLGSQDSQLVGRGGGARRSAHSKPASLTKWGFVWVS